MTLRLVLATSALLALSSPALAQQAAPVAPPAAPAAPAAPAEPTAEEVALTARVQTAAEAIEPLMATLKPQADAIRADAALSDADKETRIRALLVPHQATIDELTQSIQALILYKASSEGASPEEAAQASSMVGAMVPAQIAEALIKGEDADGE
ncbi:MAG: hypothetical protein REJ23_05835 [Brevundimonas sp.]|nr:hypothetical protein [Brevundimonas sp.]